MLAMEAGAFRRPLEQYGRLRFDTQSRIKEQPNLVIREKKVLTPTYNSLIRRHIGGVVPLGTTDTKMNLSKTDVRNLNELEKGSTTFHGTGRAMRKLVEAGLVSRTVRNNLYWYVSTPKGLEIASKS